MDPVCDEPPVEVRAEDLVVRATRGTQRAATVDGRRIPAGIAETGLSTFGSNVSISLTRTLFERNREFSMLVHHGSLVELRDVRVADTLERECASDECSDTPVGHGIAVVDGGSVEAAGLQVHNSWLCGIIADQPGDSTFRSTVLRDNPIGACLQMDTPVDLLRDIRFENNDTNVQMTDLYIPELMAPI